MTAQRVPVHIPIAGWDRYKSYQPFRSKSTQGFRLRRNRSERRKVAFLTLTELTTYPQPALLLFDPLCAAASLPDPDAATQGRWFTVRR